MIRVAHVALALAGLLILSVAPARAVTPTEQLKGSIDKIIPILEDPTLKGDAKLKERRAAIRRVATDVFDFTESARRALGPHWERRTAQERQEFSRLLGDLLERTFASRLEQYAGERIQYTGESVDGDLATVKTRIITKSGAELPVDYQVLRRGDRWFVYDVWIEGVSLMKNYRAQFNKIIQTSSYEDLVRKLKAKQSSL
ncbi:MAG: ABC transporter substrate-binding protein [Candidatus Rokubacteria bacterium]|nr:ABC transporter substrate-binding protein [Candidatus Rokubacteria bacterium]